MKRTIAIGIAALLFAGGVRAQESGPPPPQPEGAPAAAAQPRVATPPAFASGPQAEYSDAERNAGHHGTVVIRGVIGVDGRFQDPEVAVSSGAPGLDAAALAAARATSFTPARDDAGNVIEAPARMPFRFSRAAGPGGGLVRYPCSAFVQDMDWWRATFPDRSFDDHELYNFYAGARMVASGALRPGGERQLRSAIAAFGQEWARALETCRRRPDAMLVEIMPVGLPRR